MNSNPAKAAVFGITVADRGIALNPYFHHVRTEVPASSRRVDAQQPGSLR
jgi:hypothetical protein